MVWFSSEKGINGRHAFAHIHEQSMQHMHEQRRCAHIHSCADTRMYTRALLHSGVYEHAKIIAIITMGESSSSSNSSNNKNNEKKPSLPKKKRG